jgi:hypothetical protein
MAKVAASIVVLLIATPTVASFIHPTKKVPTKTNTTSTSTQSLASTSSTGTPDGSTAVATASNPVAVVVTANSGTSWIAVTGSSGTLIFSGTLPIGTSRTFDDSQLINFTIGNAGAVDMNVNGTDAGTPGAIGEVVHLQYGPGASKQG